MKPRDVVELIGLAALWGASFLFMRVAAPEFGPIALATMRVTGAALVLLPLLAWQGHGAALARHWRPLLVVGVTNSVIPFVCFGYAVLTITGGLASIFNAATPLFGAAIAWLWLRDRLNPSRSLGIAIGFAGVFGLAWSRAGVQAGAAEVDVALAVLACVGGTVAYGFSANFTKRWLAGVPPMAVAAGSQLGAALVLALPALLWWPSAAPSAGAWANVAVLAVLSTGFAYLMYFRLIAHVGPTNAVTVTFLIPVFAVAWGAMLLHEPLTWDMAIGGAVILLGTALATGVLRMPGRARLA
jgi:drug/metabolite transporter (DMT)-like permease